MVYRIGSTGPEVEKIQERLRASGCYLGAGDGRFGGGTESAVREFQRRMELVDDGIVGDATWKALFTDSDPMPEKPEIHGMGLAYRCLALTGTFETSLGVPDCFAAVSGDFDGQGMSFGALQWNFGQGTLQCLLNAMVREARGVVSSIFGRYYNELTNVLLHARDDQVNWARSLQDGRRCSIREPWRGYFVSLGRHVKLRSIQVVQARSYFDMAFNWCGRNDLRTERAVALAFDIFVQNGGIKGYVRERMERDIAGLKLAGDPLMDEEKRLKIIAWHVAQASNPRWVKDVLIRKLAIAEGTGTVHGCHVDLDGQYGIGLVPYSRLSRDSY